MDRDLIFDRCRYIAEVCNITIKEAMLMCSNLVLTDIIDCIDAEKDTEQTIFSDEQINEYMKMYKEESKRYCISTQDAMLLYNLYRLEDLHNVLCQKYNPNYQLNNHN